MPDQQPAATENTPVAPNDADTPVTAMTGSDGDHSPGGGGLGQRTGAVPAGAMGAPLGTAPNAPIDIPAPHHADDTDGSAATADRQAQVEASQTAAREPQPTST